MKSSINCSPERLNWSANEMNAEELEQAGFRANRKPIPGDWDYEKEEVVEVKIAVADPSRMMVDIFNQSIKPPADSR